MKKIVLNLTCFIILVGFITSCSNNIPQKAKKYLENKYGESFILNSSIGSSTDQSNYEIFFYSESHPNNIVKVYYENKEFKDNYYGILINDEYKLMLDSILNKHFNQIKYYFNFTANYFDSSLVNKNQFQDAISHFKESFYSNTLIFINDDNNLTEYEFNNILNELQNKGLTGYIAIYRLSTSEYDSITDSNYNKFLSESYEIKPIFKATY